MEHGERSFETITMSGFEKDWWQNHTTRSVALQAQQNERQVEGEGKFTVYISTSAGRRGEMLETTALMVRISPTVIGARRRGQTACRAAPAGTAGRAGREAL